MLGFEGFFIRFMWKSDLGFFLFCWKFSIFWEYLGFWGFVVGL